MTACPKFGGHYTFIERLTFELNRLANGDKVVHHILYTRYTMVSANISVIPEILEKVELDGTQKYFRSTKTDIVNRMTGSHIMFRGIHTSSGNQTAKLKSIHGITTFVCDEAENGSPRLTLTRLCSPSVRRGFRTESSSL